MSQRSINNFMFLAVGMLLASIALREVFVNLAHAQGASFEPGCPQGAHSVHTIVVEMGPYDLQHKYKIMEGPYAETIFFIRSAVDKTINVPESQVSFVENDLRRTAPAHRAAATKVTGVNAALHSSIPPMDLYWFTGARVDVIDENGHVLPKPIYLCHGRLDVSTSLHKRLFPNATPIPIHRLCLFTQGQNAIMLPKGYGVPLAAGDKMRVNLKALNVTTNERKKVKLRCTIYLANDRELSRPMSALTWQVAHVFVIVSGPQAHMQKACSSECCMSTGQNAPNNVTHWFEKNKEGQILSGHWVVPPGWHTYSTPINEEQNCPHFALNGPIRAAWAHVHPFCQTLSLVENLNGKTRNVFTIHARTTTASGARLAHIDFIDAPQGLPLNKKANYFLTATYNNISGKPQDSMAITGIFFSDLKFKKPAWVRTS